MIENVHVIESKKCITRVVYPNKRICENAAGSSLAKEQDGRKEKKREGERKYPSKSRK